MPRTSAAASDAVKEAFTTVPNSERMRMHWYIFGPAWEAEECERQLRRMADAHIGGVLIFPTYPIAVDDPAHGIRNHPYLSPEFLSVLRSVTVICKQLGLTADIVLGTGWPYGGPSVPVAEGAKAIRRARIRTNGADPVTLPALGAGEARVAVFHLSDNGIFSLTAGSGGTVTPPSSGGEVQVFTAVPTRMQVKRAAMGAEGLVLDHYSRPALDHFLAAVGDKLLDAVPPGGIRSIFCDSFEVYRATWTDNLAARFEERRGYSVVSKLPVLFDAAHPEAKDARCDFWRTLSELAAEEFIRPLHEWAQRRGVTTQVEAYGTPPVSLASYRYVDIPTGEHYEWKEFSTSRWASSGGRLAGKRTILAEAWTWLGLPNRFADTLEQLKLCSDLHFLCGINALYGLTYAYSPEAMGSPGWVPYFGPAVNHTSPYWPYFSHLADTVNRSTVVLQQGKPVADVALYLPEEDCMAEAEPEQLLLNWAVRDRMSSNGRPPEFSLKNALHYEANVIRTIVTSGYSFDGIDTFTVNGGMRLEGGRLRMGDGDYAVVILPNLTGIDVASLRIFAEFVRQGGILIATRRLPDTAWGLAGKDANRKAVNDLVTELFGPVPRDVSLTENSYGKGKAILSRDEEGSLRRALRHCPPDIQFAAPYEAVGFVHRRSADRDFYFLANTSEEVQFIDATFRTGKNRAPERWDLRTGAMEPVVVFEPVAAGIRLRFPLAPLESCVYVFGDDPRGPIALESDLALQAAQQGWTAKAFDNGMFRMRTAQGTQSLTVTGVPAPAVLMPEWRLRFERSTLPAMTLDRPKSWTEIPESRFFSGRAVYEAEFTSPLPPSTDVGVVLDLGSVRETADVSVNGQPAGVAWMRPYRLDVSHLLRPGTNVLRVAVTNLLINKILGDGPIDYSAVYAKDGQRFPPGEEWDVIREPFVSGLLGPVRLVYYKRLTSGPGSGGTSRP
jgi:hypothetical protein